MSSWCSGGWRRKMGDVFLLLLAFILVLAGGGIFWRVWRIRKKVMGRHESTRRQRIEKEYAEADAYLRKITEASPEDIGELEKERPWDGSS
jgi:hypothetical protein